jgi:alpha-tubulin suppressor-like RCC1 family protein
MFGSRNFLFAKTAADGGSILFMWGRGDSGQLGLGSATNRSSPVQVGTSKTWTQVSAGFAQTLAVNSLGELWSWGLNTDGKLGLGDTVSRSSPTQVGALTNWAIPSINGYSSMCIKTDDTLWTWGLNSSGQLGTGNTIDRSSPVQVGTNWAVVKGGSYANKMVLAIAKDGKLFSWGYGAQGTLGLGDTANRSSPTQVGLLTDWKTLAVNQQFAACVKTDGKLFTWGSNYRGQLGHGNTINLSSPVQVGALTDWATPSCAGSYPASMQCVKTDGTLWTWGFNTAGQLGLGNLTNYSSPKQVGALTDWAIPAGGSAQVMCSKTDNTIWAWGYGSNGQLGQGNTISRSSPVQVGTSDNWLSISSGTGFSSAIKEGPNVPPVNLTVPVVSGLAEDGETLTSTTGTWDKDPYSFTFQWQRGTSNIGGATSSTYVIQAADVGSTLRCVVTATNGIGSTPANSANTAVVIATANKLYSWGTNSSGTLGLFANTSAKSSPVQVSSAGWAIPALSNGGTVATKTNGTIFTWGIGTSGANGQGNTANLSSPVQVGALTDWSKPTRGGPNNFRGSILCVKTNGQLWAWGFNEYFGQLGIGTTTNRSSPVQVGVSTDWANISGGRYGTLGVKTGGTLFGAGYGGALGGASGTTFSQVGALNSWSKSQIFDGHSIHVKTDNTLWTMGQNASGQLGNNTVTGNASPIQIGGAVWATPIIGGTIDAFSACIRTDGTLWTWGKNNQGQLGLGDIVDRSSPVQVGALTDWLKIAGSETLMICTKTDGTLWSWGQNNNGQLGLGDVINRSSPVQVGALTNWVNPAVGSVNSANCFSMCTTT